MGLSKTNIEYWKKRLLRRSFKRADGEEYQHADYHVRLVIDGRQHWFNLKSANKEVAADKARQIWDYFQANGGEATIRRFKSKNRSSPNGAKPTAGTLIEGIEALRLIKPKTLYTYAQKLRRLVEDVAGIKVGKEKHDYQQGGSEQWQRKIDAVSLEQLTPEKIIVWRARFLKSVGQDPLSQEKAQITVNSILRNAKALFSSKYVKHLSFTLPHNPFEGIHIGSATTRRYKSRINFKKLASNAKQELLVKIPSINDNSHPDEKRALEEAYSKLQQFKILLLALGCGLRRQEIDSLLWDNLNFADNTISVETTQFGGTKSGASHRQVDVDPSTMKLLKGLKRSSRSKFVVQSDARLRISTRYYHYRCDIHFKYLINWLRQQGITRRNALHELRKEFGTQVCQQFGIYASSRALGHSDIRTTAASYLDKKGKTAISIF